MSQNRTLMIVLSYIGPLGLVPYLVEKDDPEVQWHAKHGLVLFALWLAISVALFILGQIPVLGCLLLAVWPLVGLASLIVAIVAIMKGVNGQRFIIPGISHYADKF